MEYVLEIISPLCYDVMIRVCLNPQHTQFGHLCEEKMNIVITNQWYLVQINPLNVLKKKKTLDGMGCFLYLFEIETNPQMFGTFGSSEK